MIEQPRNSDTRFYRRVKQRTTEQLRREVAQGIRAPLAPRYEGQGV